MIRCVSCQAMDSLALHWIREDFSTSGSKKLILSFTCQELTLVSQPTSFSQHTVSSLPMHVNFLELLLFLQKRQYTQLHIR